MSTGLQEYLEITCKKSCHISRVIHWVLKKESIPGRMWRNADTIPQDYIRLLSTFDNFLWRWLRLTLFCLALHDTKGTNFLAMQENLKRKLEYYINNMLKLSALLLPSTVLFWQINDLYTVTFTCVLYKAKNEGQISRSQNFFSIKYCKRIFGLHLAMCQINNNVIFPLSDNDVIF